MAQISVLTYIVLALTGAYMLVSFLALHKAIRPLSKGTSLLGVG